MNNFFVALFVDNRVCQYKIDELIQNSFNSYVDEKMVFDCKNVYLPVQIKEETYYLQSKSPLWSIRLRGEAVTGEHRLAHGDYLTFAKEEQVYSALFLDYSSMSVAQAVYALGDSPVFLGRGEDMNIVLDVNLNISRKCAAIRYEGGAHHLEDLSGKTAVYVNGVRESSKRLSPGDEIYIMGTTVLYYPDKLILSAKIRTNGLVPPAELAMALPADAGEEAPYVRTPRIIKSKEEGSVVIDPPPAPQKSKEIPFILTAGPSMTMSIVTLASVGVAVSNVVNGGGMGSLITSGVMAVSMLAGALLWPSLLRNYNKRQEEANELYRRQKYTAYLEEKEKEILEKYQRSTRVLSENYMPGPALLSSFIQKRSRRLWERTPSDEDFLNLRLGLGELDFDVEIQGPRKSFTLDDDPMVDQAVALQERYKTLRNVPISISLHHKKVVGVVGDFMEMCKVMVTGIVSLHAPDEVKLALIYNGTDTGRMQWANDLPHVWSNDRKQRYIATNKEEARSLLSGLEEVISQREELLSKDDLRIPTFVVLVLDEDLVEDIPFRRHLINPENNVGVSTIFFGKRFQHIPKECSAIIQKDTDVCGLYIKNENNNRFIPFKADAVSEEQIYQIAESLNRTPVKMEKEKASVPDRVTFLDMFKVGNVGALEITNHWGTNLSEKSLAAPIGVKAGGEVFELDIHEKYHGCHGLVAGTTGSGKSEFLQAYILSMMIHYSPNEVAFVLVDFKGGDMARPFLKSPHLAATISNLSGNTLHRALISLEAEVRRRQNLFNQSAEKLGVDKIDINSYHKHFKDKKLTQPLPHLIIVIDEFAQLKSQHPEFMAKLVDIAQVGRSLGIHLILATQRPSGVVDPQIWSNSRFKVCLKVLDKQDSMDMIGHPEAALIKQPGRAYVQVGYDEIFEQVQSGYSGADYIEQAEYIDEDSVSVSMVNFPAEHIRTAKRTFKDRKSNKTQLEEIVSVMTALGESEGLKARRLWLPPLPAELLLTALLPHSESFDPANWDKEAFGSLPCGIADYPERQEQLPFGIDFIKNGHLAIYGSSGAGKSTLVQTILYAMSLRYSPQLFNVFVMDFDGNSLANVAAMPHTARYASESDEQGMEELLRTVQGIIKERQALFAKARCASYESYLSATGQQLPMIALVLDNYAAFREKMYRSEDLLVQIAAAARSCGIYLILTGNSKGAIYYKITEQIPCRIVLNMNDSGAYRDILNVPVPIIPEQTKGRALTVVDKKAVEVQFAVPFHLTGEAIRTAAVRAVYEQMALCRCKAEYTPAEAPAPAEAVAAAPTLSVTESKREDVDPLIAGVDALEMGSDITTGEAKGFVLADTPRVFVGTGANPAAADLILARMAKIESAPVFLVSSRTAVPAGNLEVVEDIDRFVEQLAEIAGEEHSKIVLCIDGFCDFFDRISDEALDSFEKILRRDRQLTVVTLDDMNRIADYRDTGLYVELVRAEQGVMVGGGLSDDKIAALATSLYEIPQKHREKQLSGSQAALYSGRQISYIQLQ